MAAFTATEGLADIEVRGALHEVGTADGYREEGPAHESDRPAAHGEWTQFGGNVGEAHNSARYDGASPWYAGADTESGDRGTEQRPQHPNGLGRHAEPHGSDQSAGRHELGGHEQPVGSDRDNRPGDHDGDNRPGDHDGDNRPGDHDGDNRPGDHDGDNRPGDHDGDNRPGDHDGDNRPGDHDGDNRP
ncbi:MAG: hypothetical protein M3Y48_25300, partial [Actinomycetota bacterium]|nr:hypothetical protein [Actinomycetota bacterium]